MTAAPALSTHTVDLPLASLRYAASGVGDPLIIVPATISLIEDWSPMVRFMGQEYRAYFFEMPGQGGSSPLAGGFSSVRLAELIGQFADHIGAERFTLVGFSFGGILTLRALQVLGPRVERIGLLSPCVSNRALLRPPLDRAMIATVISVLERRLPRRVLARIMASETAVSLVAWFMTQVGGFETTSDLKARLSSYSEATIEVIVAQVREILTVTEADLEGPYDTPCFFGMSERDPLLDYHLTRVFVRRNFTEVTEASFDWPYHAPPTPLTYDDYRRDYQTLLEEGRARVSAVAGAGI